MLKTRLLALVFLIAGLGIGYFDFASERDGSFPFRLGLDLSGGSHLVYEADMSAVPDGERRDSLDSLRDVIERRVNLFGVAEPSVQTAFDGEKSRLIVELPGVTDIDAAIALIGQTPLLEFKVERPDGRTEEILDARRRGESVDEDPFAPTELTGRFLKRAKLEFGGNFEGRLPNEPIVVLEFDNEGARLFEEITARNVGKIIAIYLDGAPISTPVVQEKIAGGEAIITGSMTPEEAKELVGRLNAGALPVPISLLSTQTIGPSLGASVLDAGVRAAVWGIAAVVIFLLVWYRLPGLVAAAALAVYIAAMLALFKVIPVTLTAAGLAGFILSIGMAVDANVLIFERMKEELARGKRLSESIAVGFSRAWPSIRDGNLSSLLTAVILFWFSTSLVKGFALVFGIGVLVSMISAISVTRVFLLALSGEGRVNRVLFGTGLSK